MYKNLKRLIITLSLIAATILSLWYVNAYQNQMNGGVQQIVAVNKSKLDIMNSLKKIASDNHVLLAKQIPVPVDNGKEKGSVVNTFAKIGSGELPKGIIEQSDEKIINDSPNNVLYLIIGKGLTAQDLSVQLNVEGNEAMVFSNDWSFTLLQNFLKGPLAVGVFLVLASFAALILSESISNLKSAGIRRLSGISKRKLASEGIKQEGLFILACTLSASLIAAAYLFVNGLIFGQTLQLTLFTILAAGFLLFITSLLVSALSFYLLQHQPISFSIKGKMPMKTIVTIIIVLQTLSLLASMFSVSWLNNADKQLSLIAQGESQWAKNKQYFALSGFGWDAPNAQNLQDFYTELSTVSGTMIVANQFNNQTLPTSGGYLPTPNVDENMLYVNAAFLKQSGIVLSPDLQNKISNLSTGQYALLIPDSQKANQEEISTAWAKNMERWNEGIKKAVPFEQITGNYSDNKELFAYSVLGVGQVSNQNFVKSPLMIVYSPKTLANTELFAPIFENLIQQTLVTNQEKTKELIYKYHLENNLGSLVNGYYALLDRKASVEGQQQYLVTTNVLSLLSSLLLIALLNTIYLYQSRKKFLIERLAGKSLLSIHAVYLVIVASASFLVGAIALVVLHLQLNALIVPLGFVLLVAVLFSYQLRKERQANILILKGE